MRRLGAPLMMQIHYGTVAPGYLCGSSAVAEVGDAA